MQTLLSVFLGDSSPTLHSAPASCPCPSLLTLLPLCQILEAVTMQHIFMNNFQLCSEINERVVQHFVHCIETHGRNVQYIKFLQTIVKAEGKFIKKCQDMVMAEVTALFLHLHLPFPKKFTLFNLTCMNWHIKGLI